MTKTSESDVLIIIAVLLLAIVVLLLAYHFYRKKINKIKNERIDFTKDKIEVPVLATFTCIKAVPFIALAHNNAYPKLSLCEDHVEHTVLWPGKSKYSEIESVDVSIAPLTRNLVLNFKKTPFSIRANLYGERNLKDALNFLKAKKCKLSEKAREWMAKQQN